MSPRARSLSEIFRGRREAGLSEKYAALAVLHQMKTGATKIMASMPDCVAVLQEAIEEDDKGVRVRFERWRRDVEADLRKALETGDLRGILCSSCRSPMKMVGRKVVCDCEGSRNA